MAGKIPDLHAQERTGTGKGAARQSRRDSMVPGVVYGGGTDALSINIPFNVLIKQLRAGRFLSTLFNMKVEGHEDTRVICRHVQRDVVKDLPIHVDFMRLKRTSKINLFIPVEFVGEDECPGIKKGGYLQIVRPEIELVVTAGDIPEQIEVDVSSLEVNETVFISDVTLPSGAKPTIDRDFTIANIAPPSALGSGDDEEEEDAAAATEEEDTTDETEASEE